ncbi:MAG: TerB family tellurite resistance protein [Myxococcota bacterium]
MDDFSLDELKLAFTYHLAQQIVGADGEVAPAEAQFVERTFPELLMVRSGFVAEDGSFTARWREALGEALLRLPELSVAERVAMVDTLFDAAMADASLLEVEADTVRRAARLLALDDEQVGLLVERWQTVEAPAQPRRSE